MMHALQLLDYHDLLKHKVEGGKSLHSSRHMSMITIFFPLCHFSDVWGFHEKYLFIVGALGKIVHYNKEIWSEHNSGTTNWLYGIHGNSRDNVWAVGDYGTTLLYNGKKWTRQASGSDNWLRRLWGFDTNNIFAVGDYGTILYYNGTNGTNRTAVPITSCLVYGEIEGITSMLLDPAREAAMTVC